MTRDDKKCAKCFKALGSTSRYQIVKLLGQSYKGVMVGEIAEKLKLSQPTITHHLQILEEVEAVIMQKKGIKHIYTLNKKAHCFNQCKISYQ